MESITLIELYDDMPLNNVLSVDLFRPAHVAYICPQEIPAGIENQLKRYFAHRGLDVTLSFHRTDIFSPEDVNRALNRILMDHPDAMIDITGGTDAVLFAIGQACARLPIPVSTYSHKKNRFFNIQYAPSTEGRPVDISYTVEDCFMMAGGSMRMGRVDNAVLGRYLDDFDPFFDLYMEHRAGWDRIVSYIQRISPADEYGAYTLGVKGGYEVKGDHGLLQAPEDALRGMERIRLIEDLEIVPGESVSFRFRDGQVRSWLRDVGSVLELYVYKACLDTKMFSDVRTSAVVEWDGAAATRIGAVSNELDVMCTRGIMPLFISCKTCMIRTEALNELAILRDRFGGKHARAALVSSVRAGTAAFNRAAELNISIIDLTDLENGSIRERLEILAR